jgi:aspartate aminotransferase
MTAQQHVVDSIPLGGIVTVRDRLIEEQLAGKKVYRLESGDPSFDLPPHIAEAIARALRDGHTHYTAGAGIKPLREAIFRKLTERNDIPLSGPESTLVTNGAMHGLYIAFRALCLPGDEVIVPDPTWTETSDNVRLVGGVAVCAPLDAARGYRYSAAAIEAQVTPRTKAIVVNSPHNPTGVVCSRDDLLAIARVADRHGLWLISDEAYEHVVFDGKEHVSPGSLGYERVISLFSFSKSYAMSGLRLGYVAVNDKTLLQRMAKLLRCTINGVNSATQHGGVAALNGPQDATFAMAAEYQVRRDALWSGLEHARLLHPVLPEGAFYMWCRIDDAWPGHEGKRDSWAMTNFLIDRARVGSAPGDVFGPGGRDAVRFSFACSTDQVTDGARLLAELLG